MAGDQFTIKPSADHSANKPSTDHSHKPSTDHSANKPSTDHSAHKPSTHPPINKPSTGPPPTNPSPGLPPTNPSPGPPVNNPSTGPPPTNPSTGPPVNNPSTGPPPTNPSPGPPPTNPSTDQPTTDPSTDQPTTKPSVGFKFDENTQKDIQGDILLGGLPKRTQTFLFFSIDVNSVEDFLKALSKFKDLITTAKHVKDDRATIDKNKKVASESNTTAPVLPITGVNIAFTKKGLIRLKADDDFGDDDFNDGMLAGANGLGDPMTESGGKVIPKWDNNWIPGSLAKDAPGVTKEIHGLIMVTGDNQLRVDEKLGAIRKIFTKPDYTKIISEVHKLEGNVRPGNQKGHEHFGFLDGVSQPAVKGVDDAKTARGQQVVPPGVILLGQEGDYITRPPWAKKGSILAFRHLSQLVPEFNTFLEKNAISGLPPQDGAELLGARLMGRWKSGAPIAVTPTVDDPAMGADKNRNDDFSFTARFPDDQMSQDRCPFAAHIRKTNPRGDVDLEILSPRRIIRSGIAYGPEVSGKEALNQKTDDANDRGLLFVSYQSNLSNGFTFIQQQWANNTGFPPGKRMEPGFDPIIGQIPPGKASVLSITGADPNQVSTMNLTQWVKPKGGEYFFVPSLSGMFEHNFGIKK